MTENNKNANIITGDETFGEVIQKYPQVIPVFFQFGLHCIGCHISAYESIKDGAAAHGVEVEKLIEALNKAVNEPKKD
ncbi:MAG TPA: DUF1858 domain-containing protein [Caldisericia bacterium]|nr:MAG: hypothetical protein BWX90_00870 [bacterium ADurb.Bin132]HNY61141.1 DUF1858 domain-containing protein [Caldisericia bacterium]HOC79113.1 DUF1858 domain-containing protein [Caldisericia bacterium]HOG70151.1 DUF1858 domain-containing protein [Caldisericia bacterium]HPA65507.1 DUF1858 domain-containing protein [Caldisericia bacterium]